MADDVSDIAAYYDGSAESEHERLKRHQLEHDLSWRYLDDYLPPQGALLEIGVATGRYTVALAERGYQITAVDLSPDMIEVCRKNVAAAGLEQQVRFVVADARDLGVLGEAAYDAVLIMGPLYHLIEEVDREKVVREAYGRLRQGGVIFSALISRFGILGDMMKRMSDWIEDPVYVRSVLETGVRPADYPRGGFRGYLCDPAEVAPLHEEAGFETIALAAVEPVISADDESYNRLEGRYRELWLDLLYTISTEPSIVGASRHLLYVGRQTLTSG